MKTIKVEPTPTTDTWKEEVSRNLAFGRALAREEETRRPIKKFRFPVHGRWLIVRYRWGHPRTWRERWHDLVYLARG